MSMTQNDENISTETTEQDGEWEDEYGVTFSADRKKTNQRAIWHDKI